MLEVSVDGICEKGERTYPTVRHKSLRARRNAELAEEVPARADEKFVVQGIQGDAVENLVKHRAGREHDLLAVRCPRERRSVEDCEEGFGRERRERAAGDEVAQECGCRRSRIAYGGVGRVVDEGDAREAVLSLRQDSQTTARNREDHNAPLLSMFP